MYLNVTLSIISAWTLDLTETYDVFKWYEIKVSDQDALNLTETYDVFKFAPSEFYAGSLEFNRNIWCI